MTPRAFDRYRFESLIGPLKRFGSNEAMNVEQLDSLLVICCPSRIAETRWLPEVWGDGLINDGAFAAQSVFARVPVAGCMS